MKLKILIFVILSILGFEVVASGESIFRMGCTWYLPDRFEQNSENFWSATTDEMSKAFFIEDLFDETMVEVGVSPSNRVLEIKTKVIESNFELVMYGEYLRNDPSYEIPSWTVVKSLSSKGVFYIHGLNIDEVALLVKRCMPNTFQKIK